MNKYALYSRAVIFNLICLIISRENAELLLHELRMKYIEILNINKSFLLVLLCGLLIHQAQFLQLKKPAIGSTDPFHISWFTHSQSSISVEMDEIVTLLERSYCLQCF